MATFTRSGFLAAAGAAALAAAVPRRARAAGLDKLGIDYAYYNPPSLVLKAKGWLDEALAKQRTRRSSGCSRSARTRRISSCRPARCSSARPPAAPRCSRARTARRSRRSSCTRGPSGRRSSSPRTRPRRACAICGARRSPRRAAPIRGSSCCARSRRTGCSPATCSSSTCSIPTAAPRSSAGRSTRGRGSIRTWRRRSSTRARGCSTATSRSTRGARSTRARTSSRSTPTSPRSCCSSTSARASTRRRTSTKRRRCSPTHRRSQRRVADLQLRERTTYPGNGTPGAEYRDAIAGVVPLIRADKLAKPDADLDGAVASLADPRPATTALRG